MSKCILELDFNEYLLPSLEDANTVAAILASAVRVSYRGYEKPPEVELRDDPPKVMVQRLPKHARFITKVEVKTEVRVDSQPVVPAMKQLRPPKRKALPPAPVKGKVIRMPGPNHPQLPAQTTFLLGNGEV